MNKQFISQNIPISNGNMGGGGAEGNLCIVLAHQGTSYPTNNYRWDTSVGIFNRYGDVIDKQ